MKYIGSDIDFISMDKIPDAISEMDVVRAYNTGYYYIIYITEDYDVIHITYDNFKSRERTDDTVFYLQNKTLKPGNMYIAESTYVYLTHGFKTIIGLSVLQLHPVPFKIASSKHSDMYTLDNYAKDVIRRYCRSRGRRFNETKLKY